MKSIFKSIMVVQLFLALGLSYAGNAKVLIVLTSHSDLGNTGKKTGVWLPELTHPYYILKESGYTVDIASIKGGMAPIDIKSFDEVDREQKRFLKDAVLMAKVIRTIPLEKVDPKDYKVVLFSGGSGPMWDFPNNKDVKRVSSAIYEQGGVVSALCHGNAALVNIKLSNNKYLVAGKRVAAFTNKEENMLGTSKVVPFLLEDKLIERGALHIAGKAWQENVIVDGRLITGQNPASAKRVGKYIIEYLKGENRKKMIATE
ncbi:type 1 glutamine amidotransferase domain-containing protein [Lentisphaera profundi]|uniref:Type 1 glutamine amidotransferase domain-containing protein n=1 Tax=Lentisphaera profundi TaxID=1658616 RepID=A0ABY7VVX8_9BACT|nr:type 1 glutamine amidotransferase domain-containing protein [Lentisphaera profundi]WDE97047.1 type 1 glutamine amidotransferase domain-containing protein [Lentisphaera profundi]